MRINNLIIYDLAVNGIIKKNGARNRYGFMFSLSKPNANPNTAETVVNENVSSDVLVLTL